MLSTPYETRLNSWGVLRVARRKDVIQKSYCSTGVIGSRRPRGMRLDEIFFSCVERHDSLVQYKGLVLQRLCDCGPQSLVEIHFFPSSSALVFEKGHGQIF